MSIHNTQLPEKEDSHYSPSYTSQFTVPTIRKACNGKYCFIHRS